MILAISVKRNPPPLKPLEVVYLPRHVAESIVGPANIISIEYYPEYRPNFDADKNVLKLTSTMHDWLSTKELAAWIKSCNYGPVYVHCEMGIQRSKWVANTIVDLFGYTIPSAITIPVQDGRYIHPPVK